MVTRIIMLLFLTVTACADTVVVNNSKMATPITTNTMRVVDLGDRPQWLAWAKQGYPVPVNYPSLVDTEYDSIVTITGTIQQAEADLSRAVSNAYPALVKYKAVPQKDAARTARQATESNPNKPAIYADLTAVLMQIEALIERIEKLEAK